MFYKNNENLYDNFAQIFFKSKKININLEIDLITFPPQKKIEAVLNGRKIMELSHPSHYTQHNTTWRKLL